MQILRDVTEGIHPIYHDVVRLGPVPIKTMYYARAVDLGDGGIKTISMKAALLDRIKQTFETERLLKSQAFAARRFKVSKLQYRR